MKYILITILLFHYINCSTQEDWNSQIVISNEVGINTEKAEFSPIFWNEYIIFIGSKQQNDNDSDVQYDLFFTAPSTDKTLIRSAIFSKKINTEFHEGPACFSVDGNHIYFTKVDQNVLAEDNIAILQIFESTFSEGEWEEPWSSSLNYESYPTCHPALSMDNDIIVFASDRPGGYGKMDLYFIQKINGNWSKSKNLGPLINTDGNDWFPYFSDNNSLFFASDTKTRGLEIFKSKYKDGKFEKAIILPNPINSKHDDFAIAVNTGGHHGYFSSNRPGGQGEDDIYSFLSDQSLLSLGDENYKLLKIFVSEEDGTSPIVNASLRIKPIDGDKLNDFDQSIFEFSQESTFQTFLTDKKGQLQINLFDAYTLLELTAEGKESWTKVMSNNYNQDQLHIQLSDKHQPEVIANQQVEESILDVPVNVGSIIVFENIYYDYNSFEIKKGAAFELEELLSLMKENENIKIELRAHTDSRGHNDYNQNLSDQRALAAKNYLTERGIPPQKIVAKGFGESQLRNHCRDNVDCSEAEHIYNRRTEVVILAK